MSLESFNYINSLNAANPTTTDNVSEGDDHIRGVKTTLKNTFPNVTGAVTATQAELNLVDGVTATTAELNYVDGVTSAIQGQVDAKLPKAGGTMTGDIALGDNVKAKFGASDDLEVYSDGTNSRITESGSGSLIIKGTQMLFQTGTGETTAYHTADGSVRLYHNNVPKIETTSTGIDVTGSVDASGVGKFGKPSDFWASTQAYYGGAYGNITTNGSWEYEMTCNGYRNTSAQWTSLATNSYTGATSISMNPQGHIRFCTDASKADGSDSDITERMRIDSAGDVTVNTGNLVIGTAGKGIDFGDWTITESSGVLKFATGGTNKMKLDASGNLTVVGNITAYGSI